MPWDGVQFIERVKTAAVDNTLLYVLYSVFLIDISVLVSLSGMVETPRL